MNFMGNHLYPLDEQEDIKELLIKFAIFAINFERMVDKLIILIENITKSIIKEIKTAGGYINQADKCFMNNSPKNEDDIELWEIIRKRLYKLKDERNELLKGLKFLQFDTEGKGAKFIHLKRDEKAPENISIEEISLPDIQNLIKECKNLDDVLGWMTECFSAEVNISKAINEIDEGRFGFDIDHLYNN